MRNRLRGQPLQTITTQVALIEMQCTATLQAACGTLLFRCVRILHYFSPNSHKKGCATLATQPPYYPYDFIPQSLRARVADQAPVLGDMKAWHAFPLLYNTIPLVVGLTSLGFSHALPAWFLILLHHDGLLMVGAIGWFHLLVSMGGGVSVLLGCLHDYRQLNYSTYLK